MADLAATDVTVTILSKRVRGGDGLKQYRVQIAFGDGALTVPAGGIPISKADFGMRHVIESMVFYDQGTSGYKFSYDRSAEKIVVHQSPAVSHNHKLFVNQETTPDAQGTRLNLGASGGLSIENSDATIDGVSDTTGEGGILTETIAAAALAQASAVAIAAQVLEAEVIGW